MLPTPAWVITFSAVAEALEHPVEGHVGLGPRHSRGRRAGPVLDDELGGVERGEAVEQALEGLVVGADGDEDHSTLPLNSALRRRAAAAGHWAKKRVASG